MVLPVPVPSHDQPKDPVRGEPELEQQLVRDQVQPIAVVAIALDQLRERFVDRFRERFVARLLGLEEIQ